MSVTSLQFADDRDRCLDQIERLTHSHALRKAESLCKLLRYLADHALAHPGVPLKEYRIATEVFGRPADFNPQADSAIRVQAGRLRLKLVDYYSHEGLADTIVVEMPNGAYTLDFHHREIARPVALPAPVIFPSEHTPGTSTRGWTIAVVVLSLVLVAALAAVAALSSELNSIREKSRSELSSSAALRIFWSQFVSGAGAPWVVFSNAAFVGRPETGMRYLDPVRDPRNLILDHYTGVGEVLAVHELDQVFNLLKHPVLVKRGSLFSLDDARNNNLIFVGSPAENLTLLDLPGSQEFVFTRIKSRPHEGDLAIVNVHPEAGEPGAFYPSDPSQPLLEDYAIVALVRGLDPARHVMILAGTTTIGTQAAVEYVCGKDSVEELLRRLALPPGAELKPFEALLRVKVTRGVPVGTQLVAVRHRNH
ncbi:MAG TPA: hypothetical protein VN901_23015 [Candidatus Acidoferrales bacterium]|nr:hypothetical protein [Candidatus Acidoferrales bacterium]